jgi:hypothetical protein
MKETEVERPKSGKYYTSNYDCSHTLNVHFLFLVSFWCSIRVAVAFVGFIGMVAHYSQKISVGIALVCMVNHSAIDHHKTSVDNFTKMDMSLTQMDIDCPRLNNSIKIVNKNKRMFILLFKHCFLLFLLGRSISLDKKYSRSYFRRLFLGIFDN